MASKIIMQLDDEKVKELVQKAIEIRLRAYAPYSNYKVGVALLAESGKIYVGANMENAVHRCTHAERVALDAAVLAGERKFIAIVVTGENTTPCCGQCLQDLNEFDDQTGSLIIIGANPQGEIIERTTLAELLPKRFGPADLGVDAEKN